MLVPILSLALAAPAPEPPATPPKGPAPKVMVLNVDKDGRPYLQGTVLTTKMVPQQVTAAINGQLVVQTRQVPVSVMEQRQIALDDPAVTVYGADGRKIDPKELPKQAGPAPVLVSADGKEVDPFYLPLARQGTLIVVAPALAGAQTDDALPPGMAPRPGATAPPKP